MGLSCQEYLNSRRITKAKDFLRTSYRSVTEIAASLDFPIRQGSGEYSTKLPAIRLPSSEAIPASNFFYLKKQETQSARHEKPRQAQAASGKVIP
jgi:hypothetical protein